MVPEAELGFPRGILKILDSRKQGPGEKGSMLGGGALWWESIRNERIISGSNWEILGLEGRRQGNLYAGAASV